MTDLPVHVVGVRATGVVTKDDYEKVLIPVIENAAKSIYKLNFLMLLETEINHFTVGALADDAVMGLKHFTKWHKIAIVTDEKGVRTFTNIFGVAVPGETKSFCIAELEEAKRWVAS